MSDQNRNNERDIFDRIDELDNKKNAKKTNSEPVESEKERLMREVLGKKRGLDIDLASQSRTLLEQVKKNREEIRSDRSDDELLETLRQNEKILDELADTVDMSALRAEIQNDFGVATMRSQVNLSSEAPAQYERRFAEWKEIGVDEVPNTYQRLYSEMTKSILGQEKAVKSLVEAVLRPYVSKTHTGSTRNTIYIHGSYGTGRHFLFQTLMDLLRMEQLCSGEYDVLDMIDYQVASKEQVFIQDIYASLMSGKPFLLIQNFEFAFSSVSRMIGELISTGTIKLEKRYAKKNGVLQESERTLQTEHVGEIAANGTTIVFITEKSPYALIDTYGKTVADRVLDVVKTEVFAAEDVALIVDRRIERLVEELKKDLRAKVEVDSSVRQKLIDCYEPYNGVHSFIDVLDEIKLRLADTAVSRLGFDVMIRFEDDEFVAEYIDAKVSLSADDGTLANVKQEVADIVGLEDVKNYLFSLENLVNASKKRRKLGLKTEPVTRHMIFTGNPGTGKTTVARLVSKLMKAMGALKQGHLVEVTRADLVGRYVGHTAPLTMSIIQSALGGVLFIDEAYSLYRGKDDAFGLEAIDTLVKGMEDNRDKFVVILAGYSKEMSHFLTSNSGLKSRFPMTIHFEDYTAGELVKIAVSIAKKKDYKIAEEVLEPLHAYFAATNPVEKSNGRLARNVVEAAIIKQSARALELSDADEIRLLKREDFDLESPLGSDTGEMQSSTPEPMNHV